MKKLDRLDFTQVYFYLGKLRGFALDNPELRQAIDELQDELDKALGYDTPTDEEMKHDHILGEVLEQQIADAEEMEQYDI